MQEIKPTLMMARQISGRHTIISGKITNLAILVALLVLTVVFMVQGKPLSATLYFDFILENRKYITAGVLMFHFGPSNLYAIMKVLQYPFPNFSLVIYGHKTPIVNDGELPTQIHSNF